MIVQQPKLAPRWILNAFPKSGTHLLALWLGPLADPIKPHPVFNLPWTGTFYGNGWRRDRIASENVAYRTSMLQPGEFVLAHCGHDADLSAFFRLFGASFLFLYRDLRDVAVSQVYHILNDDNESFMHPDKGLYRSLGGFGEILTAVIGGIDKYPGLVARWKDYAPWLKEPWALPVSFESMIASPVETARSIVEYGFRRPYRIYGKEIPLLPESLDAAASLMIAYGKRTELSPTYRKGETGGWRKHFTPHHIDLFIDTGGDEALIEMGYPPCGKS